MNVSKTPKALMLIAILALVGLLAIAGCGGSGSSSSSEAGTQSEETEKGGPSAAEEEASAEEEEPSAEAEGTGKSEESEAEARSGEGSLSAEGKEVFTANCGSCHTLKAAGTSGEIGPNLDELEPDLATVEHQVVVGGGGMPAFGKEGTLNAKEIKAVATYVSAVAGQG